MGPINFSFCASPFFFCFRPSAPISGAIYPFTLRFSHRTSPHIPHPGRLHARCCAPASPIQVSLLSGHRLPFVVIAVWVCRRQFCLHAFFSSFPPSNSPCAYSVIYCLGLAYIKPAPGRVTGRYLRYPLLTAEPPFGFPSSRVRFVFSVVLTALADHVASRRRLKITRQSPRDPYVPSRA